MIEFLFHFILGSFTFAVPLFIYMIATGLISKYERTGGHVPPAPIPDRCHLTEQIHAAARDAGMCVDCGKAKQYAGDDDAFCWCGDFLLAINQKVDWQINELRIKYYSKNES